MKAETTGESVVFSKTAPEASPNQGALQIAVAENTRSNAIQDKAIVSFNEGDQLDKFYFGKSNAKLYIPQGGKDYAIACAEKEGEMPLNFEATNNDNYTLTVNIENMEMDYLHLIDNLTGNDVDLLVTPSYTFEGKTNDYASRFKLVFMSKDDAMEGTETFGYFAEGRMVIPIIEGIQTMQVIDMLGHVVMSESVTGSYDKQLNLIPGVYVVRLNERTQKIVVK